MQARLSPINPNSQCLALRLLGPERKMNKPTKRTEVQCVQSGSKWGSWVPWCQAVNSSITVGSITQLVSSKKPLRALTHCLSLSLSIYLSSLSSLSHIPYPRFQERRSFARARYVVIFVCHDCRNKTFASRFYKDRGR